MSITPQQAQARFGQLADQFAALVRDLELQLHEGRVCPGCRIGAARLMCQAVGLEPVALAPVDPELLKMALKEAGGE